MYQGKHYKKSPRRSKRSKRSLALLVSVCLIVGIAIGGTVAYLSTSTSKVENIFTPSKVTTEVDETFKDGVKSDVKIQNTGDTEAYIRAAVVITWQDKDGNVYGQAPVENSDYNITYNTDFQTEPAGKWILASDGFYYWTNPVDANASTGILITTCSAKAGEAPDGYSLTVEIIGSGIQSVPTSVVTTEWGVTVANDGTISKEVK